MLKKSILTIARILLVLSLPVFLLLTNLYVFMSPAFLRYEYGKADFPPSPGFTDEQRLMVAEKAITYLRSDAGIKILGDLEGKEEPLFREKELVHMVDVKVLLGKAIQLDIVLGLLLAAALGFLVSRRETRERIPFYLFVASLVAPALAIAALIIVPLQFQWFFVEFHHVFFEGDSWLFPRSDTLIQLFPERFWFNALQTWLLLVLATSAALAIGSFVWMRRTKRASS